MVKASAQANLDGQDWLTTIVARGAGTLHLHTRRFESAAAMWSMTTADAALPHSVPLDNHT